MNVFISYRRDDTAGHAGRLYDFLQARFGPDHVFMDLSAIHSGQNFVDEIDRAVRQCDALVAVIGDTWLTCATARGRRLDDPADFVRSEIAVALARGIPVIPVLVEGAAMPQAAALPDALKPLALRQANELSDARWAYDVERLVQALEKLGGASRVAVRRTRAAVAAAVALVVVLGAAFAFRTLRETPPANEPERASPVAVAPAPKLDGVWAADVKYPWGAQYTERFSFKVDGDEILGTASFLRSPRGIVSGTIKGDRIEFQTRTQEVLGDWNKPRDVIHRYRGRISGDEIAFSKQTEGASSDLPVEFTARRTPDAR